MTLGAVTCWAPTSLLGQEILQDTTTAIKTGRNRMSVDYALAERAENGEDTIALQERSQSYPGGGDTSISIFVTPETSMGYDNMNGSSSELSKARSPEGTPKGKTLQIRHSDSFDGSSYAGSSEESDNEEISHDRKKRHSKHASLSYGRPVFDAANGSSTSLPGLDNGERGLADEADYLATGVTSGGTRTADQAGAILGIANM